MTDFETKDLEIYKQFFWLCEGKVLIGERQKDYLIKFCGQKESNFKEIK